MPDLLPPDKIDKNLINTMKPGDSFYYKNKKHPKKIKQLICERYLRDGAKIKIERVDDETVLVSF